MLSKEMLSKERCEVMASQQNNDELYQFYLINNKTKARMMEEYLINGHNMDEVGRIVEGEVSSFKTSMVMRICGFSGRNSGYYKKPIVTASGFPYQVTGRDFEEFLKTMKKGTSYQGDHINNNKSRPLHEFLMRRAKAAEKASKAGNSNSQNSEQPKKRATTDFNSYVPDDDDDDRIVLSPPSQDYYDDNNSSPATVLQGLVGILVCVFIFFMLKGMWNFASNVLDSITMFLSNIPLIGGLFG